MEVSDCFMAVGEMPVAVDHSVRQRQKVTANAFSQRFVAVGETPVTMPDILKQSSR